MGLNFKLDVGLYRLNQQVACQRHRQNSIIATSDSLTAMVEKVEKARAQVRNAFAFNAVAQAA